MGITLKDIAKEVGVTPSVVSRALNGKAEEFRIKKETVELIKKKAKELNYKPNQLARSLRLKESKIIGLITPDIENPFFSALTKKIQSELASSGYSLMIFDSNDDTDKEAKELEVMKSKSVDGFIIIPVGLKHDHIKRLANEKYPFVLLYRTFDDLNINSVTVDNYSAIKMATEDLIKKGHHKIAIIQGASDIYTNRERIRGYKDVLNKYGIKINNDYITGIDFSYKSGYISAKKLLDMDEYPSAIITMSEMITLGVIQAITERSKRIPGDISLVSFDSLNFSKSLISSRTSLIVPKDLLAENAVKIVLKNIKNKNEEHAKRVILQCKLLKEEN